MQQLEEPDAARLAAPETVEHKRIRPAVDHPREPVAESRKDLALGTRRRQGRGAGIGLAGEPQPAGAARTVERREPLLQQTDHVPPLAEPPLEEAAQHRIGVDFGPVDKGGDVAVGMHRQPDGVVDRVRVGPPSCVAPLGREGGSEYPRPVRALGLPLMTDGKIDAFLALRSSEGRLLVGRDRVRLLEAVAEHGSITAAARATGISYKTVWEAVDAVNNLLPNPAFVTRAGGRVGGSAEITNEGRRLIAAFERLEERLARISTAIVEDGSEGLEAALSWTVGRKISARNVFHTEVVAVRRWPVDVEVTLRLSEQSTIHAIVTNASVEDLGLVPGRRVLALVKASFVRLVDAATGAGIRRNRFTGRVRSRTDAELNSEVSIDVGEGKTLVAVQSRREIEDLGIVEGGEAIATFEADHVILAVD